MLANTDYNSNSEPRSSGNCSGVYSAQRHESHSFLPKDNFELDLIIDSSAERPLAALHPYANVDSLTVRSFVIGVKISPAGEVTATLVCPNRLMREVPVAIRYRKPIGLLVVMPRET